MQTYTLQEAQRHLQELVDAALRGNTILIVGDDERTVQLVPIAAGKKPRKAGSARHLVKMSDDFDAPLSDFSEYME